MKTLIVSTQKAVSILKKEDKMDIMFSPRYKLYSEQLYGNVLLNSGARLHRLKAGKYALCGYNSDGSDVTCYVQ